jgi:hypothetical protein
VGWELLCRLCAVGKPSCPRDELDAARAWIIDTMPTVRFTIGQAFPAADPVARFITVLAMMSNDWIRLFEVIRASPEDEAGLRVLIFRQQAALHHEAADFIREARRQFHASVDAFVRGLDASAQENCERIVGGIDPRSPHFLGVRIVRSEVCASALPTT